MSQKKFNKITSRQLMRHACKEVGVPDNIADKLDVAYREELQNQLTSGALIMFYNLMTLRLARTRARSMFIPKQGKIYEIPEKWRILGRISTPYAAELDGK